MKFHSNITKRQMKRQNKSGSVKLTRYILHYNDPKTGQRTQRFFDRLRDAQEAQSQLVVQIDRGIYSPHGASPTIEEAFNYFMDARRGDIKDHTIYKYEQHRLHICGPFIRPTVDWPKLPCFKTTLD